MPAYEVQVKEWAKQYETARATLEMQHPDLDQEEAKRVELNVLLQCSQPPSSGASWQGKPRVRRPEPPSRSSLAWGNFQHARL